MQNLLIALVTVFVLTEPVCAATITGKHSNTGSQTSTEGTVDLDTGVLPALDSNYVATEGSESSTSSPDSTKKDSKLIGPQIQLMTEKDLNSLTRGDVLAIKFIAAPDAQLLLDTLKILVGGVDKTFSVRLISKVDSNGMRTPLDRVPCGTKEVFVSIRDSKNREAVFKATVTVKV